jgi:hypothetical protein
MRQGRAHRERPASQQSHRLCLTSTPGGRVASEQRVQARPALRGCAPSAGEAPHRQGEAPAPWSFITHQRSRRSTTRRRAQNRPPVHRFLAISVVSRCPIEAPGAGTTLRILLKRGSERKERRRRDDRRCRCASSRAPPFPQPARSGWLSTRGADAPYRTYSFHVKHASLHIVSRRPQGRCVHAVVVGHAASPTARVDPSMFHVKHLRLGRS